jgi:hypothetical protein
MRDSAITIAADAAGTASTNVIKVPGNAFKADANCTYWAAPSGTQKMSWKGNIAAIAAFLKGKALATAITVDTDKNSDSYWTVGGVSTGATLTEFKQYMGFAFNAYSHFNF